MSEAIKVVECGCCGQYHVTSYGGDCRSDKHRFGDLQDAADRLQSDVVEVDEEGNECSEPYHPEAVVCRSGLKGWRARLRQEYSGFSEWERFSKEYGLASRLGYSSALAAWNANPLVEGSVEPSDFRKMPKNR